MNAQNQSLVATVTASTNYLLVAYYIYLPIMIALTWYVAHQLFKNAKVFMNDIFHGKLDIAGSTNKLFEMGFYLLNLGFGLLILKIDYLQSKQDLFEKLSYKIGGFSIYLGIMLFFNMYLFFRGRKKSRANHIGSEKYNMPSAE